MPFRKHLEFDLSTREKMTAAYDAARVRLGIGADNPLTAKLATTIVELATTGLRDPDTLCEKAIATLQPPATASGPKALLRRITNVASVPPMSPETRS